ncbi:hypothetical protein IMSAGC012_01208 [Lachnospiraceae bacterium]|nr:hypothetical protein IMSAGC012_01208 [Lachnospiraceae bacterium]
MTDTKKSYTKEQLLASEQFCIRKDLVKAVLDEKKNYTVDEAELLLKKYLKGKVN